MVIQIEKINNSSTNRIIITVVEIEKNNNSGSNRIIITVVQIEKSNSGTNRLIIVVGLTYRCCGMTRSLGDERGDVE